MTAITTTERGALALSEPEMLDVLSSSLYPGASHASIKLVLAYCRAAGFDVMQKPVHIVPMWNGKTRSMNDVVMPGVGLYRTQASRTGHAGTSEPDFGPDVTETIGGVAITFPAWCRVTVLRRQPNGSVDAFVAREFWKENYAVRGGQEKSIAPNAMWIKRPYGQLAKCAEAQALRKAFPEIGSAPTAEEMEGKALDTEYVDQSTGEIVGKPLTPQRKSAPAQPKAEQGPVDDVPFTEVKRTEPAPTTKSGTINAGQCKYLQQKIAALDLEEASVTGMLARLGIAALDTTMTVEQFDVLKSELLSVS
jgi:phage recombination protein Bet